MSPILQVKDTIIRPISLIHKLTPSPHDNLIIQPADHGYHDHGYHGDGLIDVTKRASGGSEEDGFDEPLLCRSKIRAQHSAHVNSDGAHVN